MTSMRSSLQDTGAPLIMPIDNVLSVQGRGTIIVGKSWDYFLRRIFINFSLYFRHHKTRPDTEKGQLGDRRFRATD